jgi:hypothetical protein
LAIAFQCPTCQKPYKVKDELAGKKSACIKCKTIIVVPAVSQLTAVGDSAALEALASNVLGDSPPSNGTAVAEAVAEIPLECPYCFEHVKFPTTAAGKQQPCPSCRRIIKVPALPSDKPKDWRVVEHNLTMARKDDGPAPEGAWGNTAKAQSIVSREALLEADVVKDRKDLARPDRTKWYVALGLLALIGGGGGWWFYRGKAADEHRLGLVADAAKASESKTAPLPSGWSAAIQTALGEFYLNEQPPDLKSAVKHLRLARSGAQQQESAIDKSNLLLGIAAIQSRLTGTDAAIDSQQALPWEDAQKELRQTLQGFKDLPKEDGWLAVESATRWIGSAGPKRPLMVALAPVAVPTEADRADALACVALMLMAKKDPAADTVAEEVNQAVALGGDGKSSPRVVALLVARKQLPQARQYMAEPTGDDAPLYHRLAYAEGYARTGETADLEKARRIAAGNGSVDHQVMAMALLADAVADCHDAKELDAAINFIAERGAKFTLPAWAVIRAARCCVRAHRADLARKLADSIDTPTVKPWLELAALQADLGGKSAPVDVTLADKIDDKSAAQALAWVAIARHNTKLSGSDPRSTIAAWSKSSAQAAGFGGAAMGLQDRVK